MSFFEEAQTVRGNGSTPNTVRLAVRAELVEAHALFDRLRVNALKRTALGQLQLQTDQEPATWTSTVNLPCQQCIEGSYS